MGSESFECPQQVCRAPRPELFGFKRWHAEEGQGGGVQRRPRGVLPIQIPSFLARWRVRGPVGTRSVGRCAALAARAACRRREHSSKHSMGRWTSKGLWRLPVALWWQGTVALCLRARSPYACLALAYTIAY